MRYTKMRSFRGRKFDLKKGFASAGKYSGYINMAMLAGGGFLVYTIYKKFFGSTLFQSASKDVDKEGLEHFTSRPAAEGSGLENLKKSLATQGYVPNNTHITSANSLNQMLDRSSVDEELILRTVKSMSIQTFQLVAICYGQRELKNYRNSIAHIFDGDVWNDMFLSNGGSKLYGSLRYHLTVVLSDKELKQIQSWISKVP